MLHSEQKCAYFWSIVEYGTGAFWDVWNWSIVPVRVEESCGYRLDCLHDSTINDNINKNKAIHRKPGFIFHRIYSVRHCRLGGGGGKIQHYVTSLKNCVCLKPSGHKSATVLYIVALQIHHLLYWKAVKYAKCIKDINSMCLHDPNYMDFDKCVGVYSSPFCPLHLRWNCYLHA